MTGIKTWTIEAQTILYDRVEIWMTEDGMLHIKRPYRFLDTSGLEIKDRAGSYEEAFAWVDVPPDVQTSLVFINDYTTNKIALQEGITTIGETPTDITATDLYDYAGLEKPVEPPVEGPIETPLETPAEGG